MPPPLSYVVLPSSAAYSYPVQLAPAGRVRTARVLMAVSARHSVGKRRSPVSSSGFKQERMISLGPNYHERVEKITNESLGRI